MRGGARGHHDGVCSWDSVRRRPGGATPGANGYRRSNPRPRARAFRGRRGNSGGAAPMRGLELRVLEQKREAALADVIESCEADFQKMRVGLSGRTAAALARLLELESLCAAAVELPGKQQRRSGREDGEPSSDQALDL